jgi:hypothetical protein
VQGIRCASTWCGVAAPGVVLMIAAGVRSLIVGDVTAAGRCCVVCCCSATIQKSVSKEGQINSLLAAPAMHGHLSQQLPNS